MNQVVDEVLAGSPKYTITYNDNTTATGVQIDLETAVTTQGTPINKALFDSIQSDITSLNNNKLNVSAKATQSQAEAGTNNTNYMTALRVQNHYDYNKGTQVEAEAGTNDVHFVTPLKLRQGIKALTTEVSTTGATTIFDFTTATGTIVEIQGVAGASSGSSNLVVSGALKNQNGDTVSTFKMADNFVFYLRFDLTTKTVVGTIHYVTGSTPYTHHYDWVSGTFTTPSISMTGINATCQCTIKQSS